PSQYSNASVGAWRSDVSGGGASACSPGEGNRSTSGESSSPVKARAAATPATIRTTTATATTIGPRRRAGAEGGVGDSIAHRRYRRHPDGGQRRVGPRTTHRGSQ